MRALALALLGTAAGCSLLFDGKDLLGKGAAAGDMAVGGRGDDLGPGADDLALSGDLAGSTGTDLAGNDMARLCTTRSAIAFTATPVTSGATKPASLTTGDFNEDGQLDVAVLNEGDPNGTPAVPGKISILLGKGDGSFAPAAGSPHSVCNAPHSITSGRFAGAHRDLIVGCKDTTGAAGSSTVQLLKGNGNGTFAAAAAIGAITTTDEVNALVTADFDHDGSDDLALCRYDNIGSNAGHTQIFFQVGGVFSAGPIVEPYTCDHLTATDVNGDSRPDLIITYADNSLSIVRSHAVSTDASPSVTFTASDYYGPTDDVNYFTATGDFNNDSHPDIVIGISPRSVGTIGLAGVMLFSTSLNDYPMAPALYNSPSGTIIDVGVGDFDCDGKLDLVAASVLDDTLNILRGKGDGTFNGVGPSLTINRPSDLVIADLNGDHLPDIIAASRATTGSVGETTFTVLLNASQ